MGYLTALMSQHYWGNIALRKVFVALLGAFGSLWLITSIANFFSDKLGRSIQQHWFWFLVLGFLYAIWDNRPRHSISCQLKNRDVSIEICIGDMFKMDGALVVGSSTTFETRIGNGAISPRSVQGQFTSLFYSSESHLATDLSNALSGTAPMRTITRGGPGVPEYPIGTIAPISVRDRKAYFIAITSLNEHGVARGTFDDLKTSLPKLWEFLSTRGEFERIVMPVLGSGFARIPQPREEIVREIVKSFVAACSSVRPTEALVISIPPGDFYKNSVDLQGLERYVQHVCQYTDFQLPEARGGGSPLAVAQVDSGALRQQTPNPAHIMAGEKVVHKAYGEGVVLHQEIQSGDNLLTIQFGRHGMKKMVEQFAGLTRLGR